MTSLHQCAFGLLCLVLLLAAPPATAEGQATQPKRGGTVRLVEPGEPDSLDMARTLANYSFIVGEQIFEGLFRWTPKGLTPWLVKDVKVSADGKSWTMKLREGVKFHDGTPFNAQAVKFNLERIRDGKGFAYAGLLAPLADIKAVDEHTVHITLKTPYGPFRALLGFIYFGMQSPTALQKHGEDSGSNPVGTGPFRFQSWQRGSQLVLVRNDDYWGDKSYLDRIVVTAIPDFNGRVSALEAGDAEVIVEVPPSEVARLSKNERIQILSQITSRNQWLRFNLLKPPLDKVEVRQAVAYATNRNAYIKSVMHGQASPARNIVGPGVVAYAELEPIPYDPVKAKALLTQAGLPSGFSTTMTCAPSDELICQAVVQDLAAVGIKAKLQTLEWGTFLKYILMPPQENEYQMSIVTRISQYLDADFPIYTDFHSANWRPKGANHLFYKNADVDAWLEATRSETHAEKRQALFTQAMRKLWADLPVVPLYSQHFVVGATSRLRGVEITPNERVILSKAWLDR
jgi:peptide/nickel transport system substrate-binding protein